MQIRVATPEDLPALEAIQRAAPEAAPWPPLDYSCTVAVDHGHVIGFLVTRDTGPDESEILNLAIDSRSRRRGFAKMLIQNVILRTRRNWFLEVRESNAGAIALYGSLGFRLAGRRDNYYSDPAEAAIVMRFLS